MRLLPLTCLLTLAVGPALAGDPAESDSTGSFRVGLGLSTRHGFVLDVGLTETERNIDVDVRIPLMLFVEPEAEALSIPVRYLPDAFRVPIRGGSHAIGQSDALPMPSLGDGPDADRDANEFDVLGHPSKAPEWPAFELRIEPEAQSTIESETSPTLLVDTANPAPWWQPLFPSEKAREIERNLGIRHEEWNDE